MFTQDFLDEFAEIIEIDASQLNDAFQFGDGFWTSLIVLSTIALIDTHFNKTLNVEALTQCQTLGALQDLITRT